MLWATQINLLLIGFLHRPHAVGAGWLTANGGSVRLSTLELHAKLGLPGPAAQRIRYFERTTQLLGEHNQCRASAASLHPHFYTNHE